MSYTRLSHRLYNPAPPVAELAGGLKAVDFEVLDNNRPLEITSFEERWAGGAVRSAVPGRRGPERIHAAMPFAAPRPRPCRVREVVREAAQDRIWAGAAAIENR